MKLTVRLLLIATAVASISPQLRASPSAEWTIMVFLNGKNNLEPAALTNFLQMARIGSTDKVNVLAELGRPAKVRHTHAEGDWTGVLRFYVKKGMHPLPSQAINPDEPAVRGADMGNPNTLSDFVTWSKTNYPAKRYMVLVWNHGQGWRLQLSSTARARSVRALSSRVTAVSKHGQGPSVTSPEEPILGGYRAVSYDDDTDNFLYNREIAEALAGSNVDLIGFDACLMEMVETAYALRKVAKVLVASEELVPNAGWPYDRWLSALEQNPDSDERRLGDILVQSYKGRYGNTENATLTALDLSRTSQLANAISSLATLLKENQSEAPNIFAVRKELLNYGDWYGDSWIECSGTSVIRFHGVDLSAFVEGLQTKSQNDGIKQNARLVRTLIGQMVVSNYASDPAAKYGSVGLAIYFPASYTDYKCDDDGKGYDPVAVRNGSVESPPEFVEDTRWPDFIQSYLKLHP